MQHNIEFNLETTITQAYTISQSIVAKGKFIRQSSGPNQFAIVDFIIEPYQGNTHFLLEWCVTEAQIPDYYIPGIIEGIKEAAIEGLAEHKPIINIKIRVIDGAYNPIDSKIISYRIATKIAFRQALSEVKIVAVETPATENTIINPIQNSSVDKTSITISEPEVNIPITDKQDISLKRTEKPERIDYFNVAVGYSDSIVLTESTYFANNSYSSGRDAEEFLTIQKQHKPELLSALQQSLKAIGLNVATSASPIDADNMNAVILASFQALSDSGQLKSLYAVEFWLNQKNVPFEKSSWFSF